MAYALGAPLGYAIIWGVIVGLPTALITIPFCRKLGNAFHINPPSLEAEKRSQEEVGVEQPTSLPSIWTILAILSGPIIIIVVGSLVESSIAGGIPDYLKSPEGIEAIGAVSASGSPSSRSQSPA